jgi:asparagine synthetase B (glutamine-hydrolysing)
MLTGEDAQRFIPTLVDHFDEPFADPSALASLLLCGVAKRSVTVALSGSGGDEIFGGYNRRATRQGHPASPVASPGPACCRQIDRNGYPGCMGPAVHRSRAAPASRQAVPTLTRESA